MINLIQPLPFFDRLSEQDRFKESCDGLYKFLSPPDKLIPFQIAVPIGSAVIDYFKIVGYSCSMEAEIATNIAQIKFQTTAGKKWVVYNGSQLNFTRENGSVELMTLMPDFYYFEVSIDGKPYFSEMFNVPGNGICDQHINMEIEAWNDNNSNGRTFDNGFKFRAFFNSFITNIVPDITDEYTKDGYERQLLLRKVIIFNYNIDLDPLPNSVSIGLAYLTTLKNITIKHNGNEYIVRDISCKIDTVEGGAMDTVQLTFSIFDQDVIKTNC